MKRALITGADGFIGSHCIMPLLTLADEVHATTINPDVQSENSDVCWHQIDLLNRAQLSDLFKTLRPTHLLHLAWHMQTGMQLNAADNFKWVQSGIDLLDLFHQNGGQRIVVSGSCAEYDWRHPFLSEWGTPLIPAGTYGSTKHALQTLTHAYCQIHELSYAWARIFFTFGPNENHNRLVPAVICALLQQHEVSCTHGEQIRDYLYVKDVAHALVRLLGSSVEGPINIGSGEPIKIKTLTWQIADQIDDRHDLIRLGALSSPENDPPVIIADVNRLTNELKWRPEYDLKAAIAETIDWWRSRQDSIGT